MALKLGNEVSNQDKKEKEDKNCRMALNPGNEVSNQDKKEKEDKNYCWYENQTRRLIK